MIPPTYLLDLAVVLNDDVVQHVHSVQLHASA
jgi:hypothetical protein